MTITPSPGHNSIINTSLELIVNQFVAYLAVKIIFYVFSQFSYEFLVLNYVLNLINNDITNIPKDLMQSKHINTTRNYH